MSVPTDVSYPVIATDAAWQKKKSFIDKAKASTKTGLGADLKAAELKCCEGFLRLMERHYGSLQEQALRVRIVALWATVLGYAVTRLRHPLQPEMRPELVDAELTAAVLDAAIGIP